MYCKYCGNKMNKNSNYCPSCGKNTNIDDNNIESKGKAIASLVIGIISILISGAFFIPLPIVGLILGISYKGKCAEKTAGIILNIISIIWGIIAIIILVVFLSTGVFEKAFNELMDNVELNDINVTLNDEWNDYKVYLEDDLLDTSEDIIGEWKELAEKRSYLVFSENEYYFYKDINNMEESYYTGNYSYKKGQQVLNELVGKNKLLDKVLGKLDEFNIGILTIENEKLYENGKEVNGSFEKKNRIALILTHDNVVELILDDNNGSNDRHYYKVSRSNE